jgi:3-phosphoshikimate 1-carboxyvinyltransferase
MNPRTIRPAESAPDAELAAPPSKSVTHRALVAAALADGPSTILGPLLAEDTSVTRAGLRELGVPVEERDGGWTVHGCSGRVAGGGRLWLGDSGTSARFLLALAALSRMPSRLDGSSRLRQRPLQELGEALRRLGSRIRLAPHGGGLPAEAGGSPPGGGTVRVASGRSSQFASALMLVGSRLPGGLDLTLEPPAVSLPYVELTERVLRRFGVVVQRVEPLRWRVAEGGYAGRDYRVEGDHSTASYFLAAAALLGGRVMVRGLDPDSPQPDACLAKILERLGCRVARDRDSVEVRGSGRIPSFDLTMGHAPDLVPTLAILGLFSEGASIVRGVAHLRHKESNRLEMLARNIRVLGREAEAVEDRLEIGPPTGMLRGDRISTASDHRMAMAFAVAGLRLKGVVIDDANCVAKSDPRFWDRLEALRRD